MFLPSSKQHHKFVVYLFLLFVVIETHVLLHYNPVTSHWMWGRFAHTFWKSSFRQTFLIDHDLHYQRLSGSSQTKRSPNETLHPLPNTGAKKCAISWSTHGLVLHPSAESLHPSAATTLNVKPTVTRCSVCPIWPRSVPAVGSRCLQNTLTVIFVGNHNLERQHFDAMLFIL